MESRENRGNAKTHQKVFPPKREIEFNRIRNRLKYVAFINGRENGGQRKNRNHDQNQQNVAGNTKKIFHKESIHESAQPQKDRKEK